MAKGRRPEKIRDTDVNQSADAREAINRRLEYGRERNITEAVLLNERLNRKAHKGWDSAEVIRSWRSSRL
ncbi:hypothetical protein KEJ39_03335 [Candidatus Bathyarchaeota archaeon]|nr:hypothetical protein [Candidatus Bathyarchaeota archaeon]